MLQSAANNYEDSSDVPFEDTIKVAQENLSHRTACIFCEKSYSPLIKLTSGSLAHAACREERACNICGLTGMTIGCLSYSCSKVVHS